MNQTLTNRKLISKQEAAEILGMSVRSIERLLASRKITKLKVRGAVRLKLDEVMGITERGCS